MNLRWLVPAGWLFGNWFTKVITGKWIPCLCQKLNSISQFHIFLNEHCTRDQSLEQQNWSLTTRSSFVSSWKHINRIERKWWEPGFWPQMFDNLWWNKRNKSLTFYSRRIWIILAARLRIHWISCRDIRDPKKCVLNMTIISIWYWGSSFVLCSHKHLNHNSTYTNADTGKCKTRAETDRLSCSGTYGLLTSDYVSSTQGER